MTDFTHIEYGSTGLAVKDVQARLASLGFDLADEAAQGVFGSSTASAIAVFRRNTGLPEGEDVDLETWNALVDETFTFGDRLLYLRLPHFHGRDVITLQTALAALGFSCIADGIFGAHTEQAVREFQQNAGIGSDGIVGHSTFSAINRLRHAWEGKKLLKYEARTLGFARAAEVLERTPICIYGEDELARRIAERISNLAMATTSASRVVCVQAKEQMANGFRLMIQLTTIEPNVPEQDKIPLVVYDSDETINARMATALGLLSSRQRRIVVFIAVDFDKHYPDKVSGRTLGGTHDHVSGRTLGGTHDHIPGENADEVVSSSSDEQHAAIALLDALCLSFS